MTRAARVENSQSRGTSARDASSTRGDAPHQPFAISGIAVHCYRSIEGLRRRRLHLEDCGGSGEARRLL